VLSTTASTPQTLSTLIIIIVIIIIIIMEPSAKKQKKMKTPPTAAGTIHDMLGEEILQAIFSFLSVNDQTNLSLTAKGKLELVNMARSSSAAAAAGACIVWEERAPTKRTYSIVTFPVLGMMLEDGRVCVGQEQQFRFQLQTNEFGPIVVRIHLQNDLWDEQWGRAHTPHYCRDASNFPAKTCVSNLDIFQPYNRGGGNVYRIFSSESEAEDQRPDGRVWMLRRCKQQGSPWYILYENSRRAAPEDFSSVSDTELILRAALQYLWLCATKVASWSAVDGTAYPSATYILQQSLPPWMQPYCPQEYRDGCNGNTGAAGSGPGASRVGHGPRRRVLVARDRQTEPEFVYCRPPSLEAWSEPNERIFMGTQTGPRPWEH
jgi:hypothetical protein